MGWIDDLTRPFKTVRWFRLGQQTDTPVVEEDSYEKAKEEWEDQQEKGGKGLGPYTKKRHEWSLREGVCAGSASPAWAVRFVTETTEVGKGANRESRRKRVGMCPVCNRGSLRVTSKGNTWPHKNLEE